MNIENSKKSTKVTFLNKKTEKLEYRLIIKTFDTFSELFHFPTLNPNDEKLTQQIEDPTTKTQPMTFPNITYLHFHINDLKGEYWVRNSTTN